MPESTAVSPPVIWLHDFDTPKYRLVLEDDEVQKQIAAVHERLQSMFFEAGFRMGRINSEVEVNHLDAVLKKNIELLDIGQAGRLVATYSLKSDYKGDITAGLVFQSLCEDGLSDWKVVLKLERAAFQLNWQVAQENFTGRYRRDDILAQLHDQEFFNVEVALPRDWVELALDALEP